MALGMSESVANQTNWRGEPVGALLKSSGSDSPSWDGTNSSGFSALPGGGRLNNGNFYDLGSAAFLWSSSPNGSDAWIRNLRSGYGSVYRSRYNQRYGFSVRCLRDCDDLDGDGVCFVDEVPGCTNEAAMNYDSAATDDDGSCAFSIAGCTDATADNYNAAATDDDGSCIYPAFVNCGDGLTYQGHNYSTVAIGTQCWFAENLRSNAYANGDEIPGELTDAEWLGTTAGAQAIYGHEAVNLTVYGRLYNWHAVSDTRGLCPSGWHVPMDDEYMALEMELGMSFSEASSIGWRGTDQGAQMKATSAESPGWNGTNSSGFSSLPSGYRDLNGIFYGLGGGAFFWSSSPSTSFAWSREHFHSYDNVGRGHEYGQQSGLSVRCVLDQ